MRRIVTWCALVVVAAGVLTAVATPADAGSRVQRRAIITFDKNELDPSSSLLTWKVVRRTGDEPWRTVEELSWRAGSGMGGPAGINECAKGRGWLPDGTYRLRYHRNYHGNLIKGRAFRLDDHRCRNGRWRVQLFIHTEQGPHNTQCADADGDQVCRWEFPEINDYASAGCIKLAPDDLAQLGRHFLKYYNAGVRYPKSRVVVRVVP
jgi:hypothetical protein